MPYCPHCPPLTGLIFENGGKLRRHPLACDSCDLPREIRSLFVAMDDLAAPLQVEAWLKPSLELALERQLRGAKIYKKRDIDLI